MRSAAGIELLRAARAGDKEGINAALAAGAPVDSTLAGKTALIVSVESGFVDASCVLVESGASLLRADPRSGLSLAMIAAARGDVDTLTEYLIQEGAPIDAVDKTGSNILFHCCTGSLVRWMCERRADPNCPRADGVTPLIMAADRGNSKRCQLLLECRASANVTDQRGRSPLEYALLHKDEDLALILLEGGASTSKSEREMEPYSKAVSAMLRKAPRRKNSQDARKQPCQASGQAPEWRTWKQSPRRRSNSRGHSTPRQYASDEMHNNVPSDDDLLDTD